MVGRHSSSILTGVDCEDLGQIQLVGYVGDEPRKMLLWQPILKRRRQKENLVQIAGAESLAHITSVTDSKTFLNRNVLVRRPLVPNRRIYLRQTPSSPAPP